ncbi:MAG: hypothetical protein J5510_08420 [Prevotella sp.]|nr:hypothetical protein [Prevotella sp.]
MDISELTPEDRRTFNEIFDKNKEIVALQKRMDGYRRNHQYVQALQTGKMIDEIRVRTFNEWIKAIQESAERIDLRDIGMPDEYRAKINMLSITIFMACDIIESGVMDINDVMKKVDPTMKVEMFDKLLGMANEAKEHLEFLRRNSTVLQDIMWGDKCDDMYLMMQNKAKAIIRNNEKKHKKEK